MWFIFCKRKMIFFLFFYVQICFFFENIFFLFLVYNNILIHCIIFIWPRSRHFFFFSPSFSFFPLLPSHTITFPFWVTLEKLYLLLPFSPESTTDNESSSSPRFHSCAINNAGSNTKNYNHHQLNSFSCSSAFHRRVRLS